jgi:hypothetical protein
MDRAADVVKRLATLKTQRQPIESVWKDCFDVAAPIRSHGFEGEIVDAQRAQEKKARVMDGVTADAVRTLSSSIVSGLHPSNSRWFGIDAGDESEDEKLWLDGVANTLFENIHASNFDAEAYEAIGDIVVGGWFVMHIDEDRERGGLVFQQWPLASCYIASTRANGAVDTILREFQLTATQAANEYGINNLSDKTRALITSGKGDEKITFVLQIAPRTGVKGRLSKSMPFESITVEKAAKKIVKESGYHEFPCVVPRWARLPESVYAVGPVLDALPDASMLYELKRMHLASAELSVAGMWIAEDDGVLNPRTIKVGPRKIIVANSVDSMKPLQPAGNWQLAQEEIRNAQAAIRKILMADQLQPQDGPAMTATEVHVRQGLIRQLLGPVYGRFQAEYLQPLIERVFGLAYRAGILKPPPESLAGRNFTVKYISPMARAQKLEEAQAVERFLQSFAGIVQLDPSAQAALNGMTASRILAEAYGAPAGLLRTDAELQEIQQQQAEAQQAQQEQQMMADMATRAAPQIAQGLAGAA